MTGTRQGSFRPPLGVLLVNIGTPSSPSVRDVRRYLRQFLSDPRVLDIPPLARWALLHLVILPFRSPVSAAAYAKIWTQQGSPLRVHGQALRDDVAKSLGPGFAVELGMRYGAPSLQEALGRLEAVGADPLIIVPLFPQYAAASTGSAVAQVLHLAAASSNVPRIKVVGPFCAHPGLIAALVAVARPELDDFQPDHLLMSYHGLPVRQIRKSDESGGHCLAAPTCCDNLSDVNRCCYRAQCFATSSALASALETSPERYSVAFQSRLGRTPWIEPHTDAVLPELAARGVRRLAVICPSFVADCLETLEEIGIRAREQWREVGGEELRLVPCINAHPIWVETLAQMVQEQV